VPSITETVSTLTEVDCSNCGAEGYIVTHTTFHDADDDWAECPVCDGRGVVTA
jgi:DnaJ-class molecular chaperone